MTGAARAARRCFWYCGQHGKPAAGPGSPASRPPRARHEAAPPRRRAAVVAGVHGARARGARHRNRRARLPGNRADARRPSRHRAAAHDRPGREGAGPRGARARRMVAAARAARAPVRPADPPDRASARAHARAAPAPAMGGRARAGAARRAVAPALHALLPAARAGPSATSSSRTSTRCGASASIRTKASAGWCWCRAPTPTRRSPRCSASTRLAPREFVQVHPGSRWLFKCWPADRTAALVDRIVSDGLAVVVTGAPDDRERALVAAVMAALQPATRARVVDLTGALSLPELAALTGSARAFVGVDSAPMHIAAAMGTPAVALFGPSSEHAWGPWRVAASRRRVGRVHVPPVRPRRLRRRQGVRVPHHAAGRARARGARRAARAGAGRPALMRLAIIRQRYTPQGGAERFLEGALEALLERNVAITLYTREWPQTKLQLIEPHICDPAFVGPLWRDWGFARAVTREIAATKANLVQSYERVLTLRHLPPGRRRARDVARGAAAGRARVAALARRARSLAPVHARDGAQAVRESVAARRALQLEDGPRRHQGALRPARRAPARDLQRRRRERVLARAARAPRAHPREVPDSGRRRAVPARRVRVPAQGRACRDRGARPLAGDRAPPRRRRGPATAGITSGSRASTASGSA